MPSLRARPSLGNPALLAGALAAAALCPACAGPRLANVEALFGPDEALHVMARYRTRADEGGVFQYQDFLYTVHDRSGWHPKASSLGNNETESAFEKPFRLLTDGQGRAFVVADVNRGLVVQMRDSKGWRTLDTSAPISAAARETLGRKGQFGAAWFGADGVLRVLYGAFLYEFEGAGAGQKLARAIDTGLPCVLGTCIFDPTGDRQGEAAVVSSDREKYKIYALQCAADACRWSEVPDVDLGTTDDGGSSGPLRRVFFHTADGKAMLVRPVGVSGGPSYAVLASFPGGESMVVSDGAYFIGAAPRPGGGFVVASESYTNELTLVVEDGDHRRTSFKLGAFDYAYASEPVAVRVRKGRAGTEQAHVFLGVESTAVTHFVVDLPGGKVTREKINLR